jgi:hypothetical protein
MENFMAIGSIISIRGRLYKVFETRAVEIGCGKSTAPNLLHRNSRARRQRSLSSNRAALRSR